ncbi:protein RCC2 isoform X1 [Haemorhous mexicanus]|uniref:protein RCC2 isoform X1 n=1 Tax=Haemorhous mexicanus TaxID=30427 RepID=UPI0028BF3EBA|nr:protein RCC2 isoform X1 [Haemorhous mexicanus]
MELLGSGPLPRGRRDPGSSPFPLFLPIHVVLFCIVPLARTPASRGFGTATKNSAKAPRRRFLYAAPLALKSAMPRRKAAGPPWDAAGPGPQGGGRRRPGPQGGGRRRPRPSGGSSGGSSEEEAPRERRPRDGSPGARRPGRPGGAAAAAAGPGGPGARGQSVVICEPEHSKERIKLEGSKSRGQLLIFGATNWDLIGRKEVPKQQAAYRNLGQNLWGPHRYGSLGGLRVRSVVSGPCAAHSLLITAEGKLWSWGRNEKGQLGHGDTKRVEAPRPIEALGGEAIVAAACGRNHTLALTESGSVFAFGENKLGQLGLGNQTDAVPSPTQILYNGQPISKLGCGAEFSMVMDCKGNLYSFGCPEYGQLGHNSDGKFIARAQRIEYDCELLPRRVALFVERTKDGQVLPVPNVVVRDVACGANHTLVLDSQKRVFSWGFGGYGRLGHAEQKDEMVPRLVKLFDFPGRGAAQIYAGYTCSFAVSETGGLFFWGATNTSRESTMYPKAVQDLCGWKIRSLACGKSSVIVAADESTISWGPSPTFGELGYGDHKPKSSTAAQEVKTLDGIYTEQVAMGYSHSLVIARDESEAEQEKLRKLPEYNPRTL